MSSRCFQDISSTHFQDIFTRRLQDMSLRRLEDLFSVKSFRLPMSSRRLGRRKTVTLKTSSRRLQDQQVFAWMNY